MATRLFEWIGNNVIRKEVKKKCLWKKLSPPPVWDLGDVMGICKRVTGLCTKFRLLPLEPFALTSLGAAWPGASPACTPAPGGKPRAHLAPPDLPSRHTQADTSKTLCQQPFTLFHKRTEAEFSKIQWPRCLTTGARHMASASRGRAPRAMKQQPSVVW